jgi:hypothetical protein
MMRARGVMVGLSVIVAAGLAACSSSSAPSNNGGGAVGGSNNTITASSTYNGNGTYNWYFAPTPDTVAAGTAVTFTWSGAMHSVHFDAVANAPDSVPTSSGGSFSRTFTTPGTYNYHCTIHPMSGVVVVQ